MPLPFINFPPQQVSLRFNPHMLPPGVLLSTEILLKMPQETTNLGNPTAGGTTL
jgi:hypothetical protein